MCTLNALLIICSLSLMLGCESNLNKAEASNLSSKETTSKVAPAAIAQSPVEASPNFDLVSILNAQKYRIHVQLPNSYASNTTKHYPIVIKVDGQWDFSLMTSAYNCVYFDGQMPETIFIGIEWADVEGSIHNIRSRDLLPGAIPNFPNSGNAKTFANIIASEIIPALGNRFRLNGQHFLLGGSWGGTFVTYALLERPDVFSGAIAIAGDYVKAAEAFNAQLQSVAHSSKLSGKRLFIGVGQWDSVAPSVISYANKLKSSDLKGLQLKVENLPGFGHSGMNVPGYAFGYQFMFERAKISLSLNQINKFVGSYKSTDKDAEKLDISVKGDNLVVKTSGDETYLLNALSETTFYHPGAFYNLTFAENIAKLETFFGSTVFVKMGATQ